MKNIKKYHVEHTGLNGSITLEINHSFIHKNGDNIDKMIKSMVDFWSNSSNRLLQNEDNYLITFLKHLCEECMRKLSSDNLSLIGLIKEFDDNEGWYTMDGKYGFKLTDYTKPDFNNQDLYEISELL